jgi:dihydrofolate reductase
MRKVLVFNSVTLDGYFTGRDGELEWAHQGADDPEWQDFVSGNASGDGTLLMGRKTYDMMVSYWPTPEARKDMPEVAEGMNSMAKIVFSRTLDKADWSNTRVVKSDPAAEVRRLKKDGDKDMTVLGSGTIVSLLTQEGLVDEYQMVMTPVVLGQGRTMFEGMKGKHDLKLVKSRPFKNGRVVLTYQPKA